jgi:thiol-disulfide isomerase/thioredoxin
MRFYFVVACIAAVALLSTAAPPPAGSKPRAEVAEGHQNRKNKLHLPIPNIVDLRSDYFDRYIKPKHHRQKTRYWLVLFYTSWCATCDEFVPVLRQLGEKVHEKLADEHLIQFKQKELPRGQLSIGKHDTTSTEVIAQKYGVEGYPTVLLFDRDDQEKITKFEGERSFESLLDFIREHTDVKI